MNWKRILTAGVLAGALTVGSAAALTVDIGGEELTNAYLENGTTYVPLRQAAQCLGNVEVSWKDGVAHVDSADLTLTARPGETWLEANGRFFYIPGGVRLEKGRTMVPVRALAAAMGAEVTWNGSTQTVRVSSGSGTPAMPDYNEEDLYWMARIISAESRGEPLLGKLAVGTVVLNRVASEEFPDTVREVIFDTKYAVQFTPTANGSIYMEPTGESVIAAKMVLDGVRAAGKSLYFFNPALTSDRWAENNRDYVTTIGCHRFFR